LFVNVFRRLGFFFFALALLGLSACGGGDVGPIVSEVRVSALQYGKTATLLVAGERMNSAMKASIPGCSGAVFSAASTPTSAVLNCTAERTGDLPLSISDGDGRVLYSGAVNVPLPQVMLVTTKGSVTLELRPDLVKNTVDNFLAYVGAGFYTGTIFHRVIPGFVVQGGGYTTGPVAKADLRAAIALESNKGLSNVRGSVAMARTDAADSATSQFFINLVDNKSLDYGSPNQPGYAVFGNVVSGLETIDAIGQVPTTTVGVMADVPQTDISVRLVLRVK
jgi:peptidyl-prolyl cis-trans isomerase A (cyclophilin A)